MFNYKAVVFQVQFIPLVWEQSLVHTAGGLTRLKGKRSEEPVPSSFTLKRLKTCLMQQGTGPYLGMSGQQTQCGVRAGTDRKLNHSNEEKKREREKEW